MEDVYFGYKTIFCDIGSTFLTYMDRHQYNFTKPSSIFIDLQTYGSFTYNDVWVGIFMTLLVTLVRSALTSYILQVYFL